MTTVIWMLMRNVMVSLALVRFTIYVLLTVTERMDEALMPNVGSCRAANATAADWFEARLLGSCASTDAWLALR